MAEVRPFRALRYNHGVVGDLAGALSPPYDVISPEGREALYDRSPFNVVRLEFGRPEPDDDQDTNVYVRAAGLLEGWREEAVLVQDYAPAYYLVSEEYRQGGQERRRLGLFAAVRLEEYGRGVVIPHEQTRPGPKEDRLRLMRACRAVFSPLMALYRDPGGVNLLLLQQMEATPPSLTLDREPVRYRLWPVDDPEATAEVQRLLASQPLYLADGHHRYETALHYRDTRRAEEQDAQTTDPAYDFALICLIDLMDPGFEILAFHRLLSGLGEGELEAVWRRASVLFHVRQLDATGVSRAALEELLAELEAVDSDTPAFGVAEPSSGRLSILSLRSDLPAGLLPTPPAPEMRRCESWVLHQGLLDSVLGEDAAQGEGFEYVHDLDVVAAEAARGKCQLLFLLRPMQRRLFESLVAQGQRLPPKTTYFDPKLPTGLVMHLLDGEL